MIATKDDTAIRNIFEVPGSFDEKGVLLFPIYPHPNAY
jgi:hypothetical protein